MSDKQKAVEEFVAKVIAADRIQHADQLIKSLDALPPELVQEATELFVRMITHLEQ